MKKLLPFLIVLVVLLALMAVMKSMKPVIEKKAEEVVIPMVQTIQLKPQDYLIPIISEGIVKPKAIVNLTAEVSGKITKISDAFANSGSFKKGDLLIQIDPSDFQLAITKAQANVSSQQANLELQQAKSDLAQKDWKKYGKKGKPSSLNLNLPQVKSAQAALAGAQADLKLAKRNLDKTQLLAPYDGVVLQRTVNIGQFVNVGTQIGQIASAEVAEVRVSLSDEQISFIQKNNSSDQVTISSLEIGNTTWNGHIVNIESQRDARTLLNTAIINVPNPLTQNNIPLRFNSYVNIELKGNTLKNVFALSRNYIQLGDKVKVLDSDSKLQYRELEIAYSDSEFLYIKKGIKLNDEIITTQIPNLRQGSLLNKEDS